MEKSVICVSQYFYLYNNRWKSFIYCRIFLYLFIEFYHYPILFVPLHNRWESFIWVLISLMSVFCVLNSFLHRKYFIREFYLCPKLFIPLQYQLREFCLCPEQSTCCHTYPRQSYVRQNLYFQCQHPKFWNHSIFRKRNCLVEKLTNGVAAEQYPGSFSAASSTHVAHQPSFN